MDLFKSDRVAVCSGNASCCHSVSLGLRTPRSWDGNLLCPLQ